MRTLTLSRKPNAATIDELVSKARFIIGQQGDESLEDYLKYHQERLALDLDWLSSSLERSSRILEVGGFPFFLTSALLDRGYRLEVIDKLSDLAATLTQSHGLKVTECDIEREKLPFADGSFDDILFNEVFEHMRLDLVGTMEEVFRVLRPKGRLWLSTPNLGSLRGIINLLLKNESWAVVGDGVYAQYMHLRKTGWMGHVREYTSKEVVDFLLAIGFKLEVLVYRGGYTNPLAQGLSTLIPRLNPYFSCIATKPQ